MKHIEVCNFGTGYNMTLKARRLSSEVYSIFKSNPAGTVHSVFNTSFNLIFADRMVHIGPIKNGVAPFGISLDWIEARRLTHQVHIGQPVTWEEDRNQLVFEGICLLLEQAEITIHSFYGKPFNCEIVKANLKYVATKLFDTEWETGIVQTNETKNEVIHYLLTSRVSGNVDPIVLELNKLLRLAGGDKTVDADAVFNTWIGRGPGLTPSGDDVITGICVGLTVFDQANSFFIKQLKQYIGGKGKQRTTQIGLEYLLYATKNKYHSHLVQLCERVVNPRTPELLTAMEQMQEMGHTSGVDTLIGLLLGLKGSLLNRHG